MIKQNLNSKKGKEREKEQKVQIIKWQKKVFQQLYYREPTKSQVLF